MEEKEVNIEDKEVKFDLEEFRNLEKDIPDEIDKILAKGEITAINNLISNYKKGNTVNLTYNGINMWASGEWINYTGAKVSKISFFLINQRIGDGALGRAIPPEKGRSEGTVILNLYEINKFLVNVCAKDLGIPLTEKEAVKMVFREEAHQLRTNRGEWEADVDEIKTLPSKYAMLKIYAMCRNINDSQGAINDRQPTVGYQDAFKKYKGYMNTVGCTSYKELDKNKLSQMIVLIKKEK